ncbi:MAG: hypothetical protein C0603_11995 [Denitrovibrio sp.]|nr:MAG: hypothetical protein C0603_11995 [Denitrovibrio sp.]
MKHKLISILIFILITTTSFAYVIQGTVTEPVIDGKIVDADSKAKEKALLKALQNYFGKLKASQPDKEIPDVTIEFFKFIKSYKIAERAYVNDNVTYTILADVDDVALNDLMYFVKNVVNTAVYNLSGVKQDLELDTEIIATLKEYKFDAKHQSEFQANLQDSSKESERVDAFRKSQSQYMLEMSAVREPAAEGECTVVLTTKTFSKTKEFQTLKTKSSEIAENEEECVSSALNMSLLKTLGYVRKNFIPLPANEKILKTFEIVAENYDNFATPKKIMEELKTRSFIDSYKIINFADKKLNIELQTFVDINVLIKKLQSIEADYGFSTSQSDTNNILLDFTY